MTLSRRSILKALGGACAAVGLGKVVENPPASSKIAVDTFPLGDSIPKLDDRSLLVYTVDDQKRLNLFYERFYRSVQAGVDRDCYRSFSNDVVGVPIRPEVDRE